MIVKCDKCGGIVPLKLKSEKKRFGDELIERMYMECPGCGERYTAYYESDTTKRLKEELKRLTKIEGEGYARERVRRIRRDKKKLVGKVEKLKKQYEKLFCE